MPRTDDVISLLDRVAVIAKGLSKKLVYLIGVGAVASIYLAWSVYSVDSSLGWNIVKCGLVILPSLIWVFIWSVLEQLQEAPALVKDLIENDQSSFSNLKSSNLREPTGLASLFSLLRTFRREDGLNVVIDTVGGVGLLANPLFAVIAFVALCLLLISVFVALFLLIF